jgi:spore maturation protein SpmB
MSASERPSEAALCRAGWRLVAGYVPYVLVVMVGIQVFGVRTLGLTDWRLSVIEPVARQRFGHPSRVTNA